MVAKCVSPAFPPEADALEAAGAVGRRLARATHTQP